MTKITRSVLESYIACRYKAYLMLASNEAEPRQESEPRPQTNYEQLPAPLEQVVRAQEVSPLDGVKITPTLLSKGLPEVIGCLYETKLFSLRFDGIRKVPADCDIADFHYIPILLDRKGQTQEAKKCLLDVYGFILGRLQGTQPQHGILDRTKGKSSVLPLSLNPKRGERLLHDLLKLQANGTPPGLFLNSHCPACQFKNRCRAKAIDEDNLSLLRGISQAEIARLNKKGIFTINQLSYTFRPRRIKKRAKKPAHPHYFALQALAIREKKTFVHGSLKLELKDTRIYLDIEGISTPKFFYLIGLLVIRSGVTEVKSFWADTKQDEARIFTEMLDQINQYGECSILHYGAYEIRALEYIQRRLPPAYAQQVECILKHSVNILRLVGLHVYFPVYSNSLKEVARFLGHAWSSADASGLQALHWRKKWDSTRDELAKEELIRYNLEDCVALRVVTENLEKMVQAQLAAPDPDASFFHTDQLAKDSGRRRRFQKLDFALPDFDIINHCSYFDYQRDRLSARSRRTKLATRKSRASNPPKNNKIVEVFADRCVVCRSKKVRVIRPLKRQILDLKFSGAAVRRWVVLYVSNKYRCSKCNSEFVPAEFPISKAKFGKGLVSWCIYQMVAGGQNMARIRAGLTQLFGLEITNATIYRFKEAVSTHYRQEYVGIIQSIMRSSVVYIDETNVNLRSEAGYVWCITDGRSVFYFYRSSREGSFLPGMFKDFTGILVSDFYAAYDAVNCRQQRCLVHLMRDFNEEIHDHPFDDELKMLAARFSAVLRSAVETIDRYGFKSRHLSKHKNAAYRFQSWVENSDFSSAAAGRLRARIVKHRDRLFTFLDCNGVSWNNTIAERFIKPFARLRRTASGKFTDPSIGDFLVILSVAQTCIGHGQDLLEFLTKGDSSMLSFATKRPTARFDSEAILERLLRNSGDDPAPS